MIIFYFSLVGCSIPAYNSFLQIERIYNNNDGLSHKDIQQFT